MVLAGHFSTQDIQTGKTDEERGSFWMPEIAAQHGFVAIVCSFALT